MYINHRIVVPIAIREDLLLSHRKQQKAPAFSEEISSYSFREQFLSCGLSSSCFGRFAYSHSSTVCTTLEADLSHYQDKQLSTLLRDTACQKEVSDEEQ